MMNNGPPDNAADKAKQDAEEEEPKKIIRLITVTAYMISVSFVGLSLSTYYIFLWNPPNPRLMHAQARESHSERLIDDGLMASRRIAENEIFADRIDLFSTQRADDAETLKTRREIVDTVNAILRAKFEQTRSSSEAPLKEAVDETFMLRVLNNSLENPSVSFVPNNITEIVTTVTPESSSPPVSATEDNKESSSPAGEESTPTSTDDKITTDSTASLLTDSPTTRLPTRWTKSHVKKQHQTPFALKHLEVPIKSGGARKRPLMRIMTTTRRSQLVSLDAKASFQAGRDRHRMQIPRKMSAQNVMASISRTLGTRALGGAGEGKSGAGGLMGPALPPAGTEVKLAGEESKDKLYEPKHKQKLVRVLTVVAYIISVSLAAIVLSLYYMYIWNPADHPHYVKLRTNTTGNSTGTSALVASTVRTLCLEIGQAVADEQQLERLEETSMDGTTPLSVPSTESSRSSNVGGAYATRSLYKTLTTPASRRDDDYLSSTDFPEQLVRRPNGDDYQDERIVPAEDVLDD